MDKQRYKITTGEHISTYQLMGIPKILAPSYQVAVYFIQLASYCRTGVPSLELSVRLIKGRSRLPKYKDCLCHID